MNDRLIYSVQMYNQRSSSAPDPSISGNPGPARQLQNHTTAGPHSSHSQRYHRGRRGKIPSSPETEITRETGHGRDIRFARYPVIPPVGQNWTQRTQQRNSDDGGGLPAPPTTRRAFESERPVSRHGNTDMLQLRLQPPHRYRHDDNAQKQLHHHTTTGRRVRRTNADAQGRQMHHNDLLGTQYPVLAGTLPPIAGVSTLVPTVQASYVPFQPMPTTYPMFPPYCPPMTMPYMNPYMPFGASPMQYAPPLVQYPMVVQQGLPQSQYAGATHSRLPEIPELSPTDPTAG